MRNWLIIIGLLGLLATGFFVGEAGRLLSHRSKFETVHQALAGTDGRLDKHIGLIRSRNEAWLAASGACVAIFWIGFGALIYLGKQKMPLKDRRGMGWERKPMPTTPLPGQPKSPPAETK